MSTRILRTLRPTQPFIHTLVDKSVHIELNDGRTLSGMLVKTEQDQVVLEDRYRNIQFRKGYFLHSIALQDVAAIVVDDSMAAY